uniref:uncharacterized protein LOC122591749 n=1 Tax=Erigeron canadensis TaxID=72917 RepID=UPI001CB93CED|nr:uncharacterized protein LOC122591749 [Erigeron canadensis]
MIKVASWNIRGLNKAPKQKEVHQVMFENKLDVCAILESHVSSLSVDKICAKVMHSKVYIKATKKSFFCSFVYAHNRYLDRRELWNNLSLHNQFVHQKAWCLLGDFNVALNLEDKSEGSSTIDIALREFKDCIENLEVTDVNRSGLHYTWNQKARGKSGLLKKIDLVMANQDFLDSFIGVNAIFQPFRSYDHAPSILRIPLNIKYKPKPFKFFNLLVHNPKFKVVIADIWKVDVPGFWMYRVVQRLKLLKKPLRKLLYDQGNLHEKVQKLRLQLDTVQIALDKEPQNPLLTDEHAIYLQEYNNVVLDEERFLKQKAKVHWLEVGDSNIAYFHKVVKGCVSNSRIDTILDSGGNQTDGE